MLTTKFRHLLEKYQRKKWFPHKYPDIYGEFIDYVSEGMIRDLVEQWKKDSSPAVIFVANYIRQILPSVQFHDLYRENLNAFSEPVSEKKVMPNYLFYYLRSLPEQESNALWNEFKTWSSKWETPMVEWLDAELRLQKSSAELEHAHDQALGLNRQNEMTNLERGLRVSREFFDWMLKKRTTASTLPALLQYFRFKPSDEIADWNDFGSLAKSFLELSQTRKGPHLQRNDGEDATQMLFPLDPPRRLIQEFGKAAGVWDSVRFLYEFGKAIFYAGMNPALPIEHRICGDPSLPSFWGYLYSLQLARKEGLNGIINPRAEELAEDVSVCFQFWIRDEAVLALYHHRVGTELKDARDYYVSTFSNGFLLEVPDCLYLYDLERASGSFWRVLAYRGALAVEERLRSLYGSRWFASEKCSGRIREYWRSGFQSTLQEILEDLDASPDPDFLLSVKG
jgi:hypothetical protein